MCLKKFQESLHTEIPLLRHLGDIGYESSHILYTMPGLCNGNAHI
jgi:hypothetical protein